MKKILLLALPMMLLVSCGAGGSSSAPTPSSKSSTPVSSSESEESSQEVEKVTLSVKIKVPNLKYHLVYEGAEEFTYWKIGDNYMEEYNHIYGGNKKTSYFYKKDADGKFFQYSVKGKALNEIESNDDWGEPAPVKVSEEIAAGNYTLFSVESTHTYPKSKTTENLSLTLNGVAATVEATKYVASTTGTILHWISNESYDLVGKQEDNLGKKSAMKEIDSRVTEFPIPYIPE